MSESTAQDLPRREHALARFLGAVRRRASSSRLQSVRSASTSSTTASCSRSRAPLPAIMPSAASTDCRPCTRRLGVPSAPSRRARLDRIGARPLRDRGRRRSDSLRPRGSTVRRRLHRTPGDSGRRPAHRRGGRDPLEDTTEGRQSRPTLRASVAVGSRAPSWRHPSYSFRFPSRYVFTHAARAVIPRAELGAAYEQVAFTTSDGLRLRGWYVPSKNRAAVIAFPGRKGPQKQARTLVRHGYGVLLFDRRGEGEAKEESECLRLVGGEAPSRPPSTSYRAASTSIETGSVASVLLGRGRDAAPGGGRVGRPQGGRVRWCGRPLDPRGSRQTGCGKVARDADLVGDHGGNGAFLEPRAPPNLKSRRPGSRADRCSSSTAARSVQRDRAHPHLLRGRRRAESGLAGRRRFTHRRYRRSPPRVRTTRRRILRPDAPRQVGARVAMNKPSLGPRWWLARCSGGA